MPEKNEYAHLLHEGERILWEGRPEERFMLPRGMLTFVLAFLAVMAIFAPWGGGSWTSFFVALGWLGGLLLLLLAFLARGIRRRINSEIYLLTDRRVMTVVRECKGFALRDVRLLRNIDRISVQREGKGCATIYIGPQTRFEHYSWLFVPDGETVAELIRSRTNPQRK